MIELLKHVSIVLAPLVVTSSLHMVLVKLNGLAFLKIPIWESGFGKNKTWRGVFFVPLVNGVNVWLVSHFCIIAFFDPFWLGYLLGIVYLLFELPNSFLKRKLGIQSGVSGQKFKYLFYVLDKTDSSLGVTLSYYIISGISIKMSIALFLTNSFMHTVVAFVLIKLKIKSGF